MTLSSTDALAADTAPVATTASGKIRGYRAGEVMAFKGVPYAGPTAGAGRFRPPTPVAPWVGVRKATAFGASAPQRANSTLNDQPTSDDCLFLNVWTRGLDDGKKRPVMFWLHGGGFSAGSGAWPSTDGVVLANRGDVVVVTINHRLSALGFLHLAQLAGPEFIDSGNVGMLDIVAALQWVKANISKFGGDPDNVLIFGESGGGAKVSVLLGMPSAQGLFHRAIIQSGAHLTGLGVDEATENARLVMAALGLAPTDVAKLQEVPPDKLLDAVTAAQRTPGRKPASFSPVSDSRVLPGHPWIDGAPAISANIPIMVGSTRTETTLLLGLADPSIFDLDDTSLRTKLAPWLKGADMEATIATFRAADPQATPSDIYFAITTDLRVRKQSWVLAERKVAQGAAPIYMYELFFDGPGKMRSPHGMDVALVFDNAPPKMPDTHRQVAAQMAASWIAFARNGQPDNPLVPAWTPYTPDGGHVMLFNPEPRLAAHWRADERAVLAALPVMRVDR